MYMYRLQMDIQIEMFSFHLKFLFVTQSYSKFGVSNLELKVNVVGVSNLVKINIHCEKSGVSTGVSLMLVLVK